MYWKPVINNITERQNCQIRDNYQAETDGTEMILLADSLEEASGFVRIRISFPSHFCAPPRYITGVYLADAKFLIGRIEISGILVNRHKFGYFT